MSQHINLLDRLEEPLISIADASGKEVSLSFYPKPVTSMIDRIHRFLSFVISLCRLSQKVKIEITDEKNI